MMKRMLVAVAAVGLMALPAAAQFQTITSGPLSGTCAGGAPSLGIDALNQVVYGCGTPHVWQAYATTIAALTAQTAVTTVTTAQTMGSVALTAGFQNVAGRTLRICGAGIYTTPGTTTPTMTISLIEGGITPITITTAALSATATTNAPFQFCFTSMAVSTGATGTLETHGYVMANISANTPAAAAPVYLDTNTAVSSAIDLTAANTLAVQVAANSAISSVQLRQLTVVALN